MIIYVLWWWPSWKPNCPGMIIGRSSVFYADQKSKMAATTGHSINTGPYGENTEIYSSLNYIWCPYYLPSFIKFCWVVSEDLRWQTVWRTDGQDKNNMSPHSRGSQEPAGLSLILDPMGKMFQNASSLKPHGQLKPNCPGMIIGRFS
jgi:hypothetical protein